MKWLLLSLFFVMSCDKCPPQKFRDYKFGDKAKVIGGFYEGQEVEIVGMKPCWQKGCQIGCFEVYSYKTGKVLISQYNLFVERK